MTVLITGVLVWALVHLMPTLAQPVRQSLVERLGNNGYRAAFSILLFAAITIMVIGWRSTPEVVVYVLPEWSKPVGFVLILLAFLLIGAAHHPTRIKQYLRHPMLAGVAVWALSHLLQNGTTRALVLFGGIGLWALIEIPLINRREGPCEKPGSPSFSEEIKGLFISAIIFVVVLLIHPWIAGVSPFPR